MKLIPTNDRVLINIIPGSDEKKIISSLKNIHAQKLPTKKATIVKVGPEVKSVKEGDVIYIQRNRGIEIEDLHLIFEKEILAIEKN